MGSARVDPRIARSRAAVLSAVGALLVEGGLRAATLDAVVARSGVARATVYRHWPNQRELVRAALAQLCPPPVPMPDPGPVEVRLTTFLTGLAAQLEQEPWAAALPALLDAARRDRDLAALVEDYVGARRRPLAELVTEAVQGRELNEELAGDAALDRAAAQLLGPVVFRHLILGEPATAEFVERIVADFLAVHRRRPDGGR